MFGGLRAPKKWALCDGQLLPIIKHEALFYVLKTTYGGDGRTTFALPDLRGRIPVNQGTGRDLSPRIIATPGGSETQALAVDHMVSHTHAFMANTNEADKSLGHGAVVGAPTKTSPNLLKYEAFDLPVTFLNSMVVKAISVPHENLMPTQCVSFIIALAGSFPTAH